MIHAFTPSVVGTRGMPAATSFRPPVSRNPPWPNNPHTPHTRCRVPPPPGHLPTQNRFFHQATGFSFTASTGGSKPALSSFSSPPACSRAGGSAGGGSIGWLRRRQLQHHGGGVDVNGGGGCGSHLAGSRRSRWKACFSGQGGAGGEQRRHPQGSWRGGGGGGIAAGWSTEAPTTNRQRRRRQKQRRIPRLAPLFSASGADSDSTAVDDGTGGLLFGDPEGHDDDEMVVEVEEEELREEWAARGLNPEAFDPLLLLQMWEEEEDDGEVRLENGK